MLDLVDELNISATEDTFLLEICNSLLTLNTKDQATFKKATIGSFCSVTLLIDQIDFCPQKGVYELVTESST